MKKTLALMLLAMATAFGASAADHPYAITGKHTFTLGNDSFLLDGKPFLIRCAEMHFARVPPEYWRHRIRMCRAAGFNAVCAYMFWNFHEPRKGEFIFTGDRDIRRFCEIAQEEGMWVVFRPGPYTCAEWEFGGFPWWLLKDDEIIRRQLLRTSDPRFMEPAKAYLAQVAKLVADKQITRGGNIIMVQCENEYGFWGDDASYMREQYNVFRRAGFDVPLFCCNGTYTLRGLIPELLPVINFGPGRQEVAYDILRKAHPTGPMMCGEFYAAWFDSWGEAHQARPTEAFIGSLDWMLTHNMSFSVYMAHGGTSFGWWAGCNAPFRPQTSSYDYEAPVSEAGHTTPKFFAERDLFAKHLNPGENAFPEPPPEIPMQEATVAATPVVGDIWKAPGDRTVKCTEPLTFEKADFGYGYAIYRTTIPAGLGGDLAADVRDLGVVRVDGATVGYFDRRPQLRKLKVRIPKSEKPRRLEILVEEMGRYNFDKIMHESSKGIVGSVTLGGQKLTGWTMTIFDLMGHGMEGIGYTYKVKLAGGRDTYLDMHDFRRGMVCVNGHWIGRYWSIGPTQTMYTPGCWLKDGENTVQIFDVIGCPPAKELKFVKTPVLGELRPETDYFEVSRRPRLKSMPKGAVPAAEGEFENATRQQTVTFRSPKRGRYFMIACQDSWNGRPFAACSELNLLDAKGRSISHGDWTIAAVSSEERKAEDNSADNAIDGQIQNNWHTDWNGKSPHHYLVIDLGRPETVTGFEWVPRQNGENGRVRHYKAFMLDSIQTK